MATMALDIYVFEKIQAINPFEPVPEQTAEEPEKEAVKIRKIRGVEDAGLSGFNDRNGQYTALTEVREDMTRTLSDGSRITRLEDGYGNASVTRTFRRHELLRMVLVRIKANGERAIFVYGRNGEVKPIPRQYWARIFSAPGSELASAAQIYDSANVNEKRRRRLANIRKPIVEDELSETAKPTKINPQPIEVSEPRTGPDSEPLETENGDEDGSSIQ